MQSILVRGVCIRPASRQLVGGGSPSQRGCTMNVQSERSQTVSKWFLSPFPHPEPFPMLPFYSKHDFIKRLWALLMLNCIKKLDKRQRKIHSGQGSRKHTRMTSLLAPSHGVVLGPSVGIIFTSNSRIARNFWKCWDLCPRVLFRF